MAKKKKASFETYELTIKDVILSYPVLANPKPFKGKSYYSIDGLMKKNHPQIERFKKLIELARKDAYGPDKSEWPDDMKEFILNGDDNEGSQGYAGKFYFKASTQNAVPVVDMEKKAFSPSAVKGGMWGSIAVNIKAWENDGDTGVSVYLAGVQVNTDRDYDAFGGGKSVDSMFGDSDNDDDNQAEDDEDEKAVKKKKKVVVEDDEDEDYTPPKKKKKPIVIEDDEDEEEDDE
jgi:hypothetical protein